jgi:hypothetical protein
LHRILKVLCGAIDAVRDLAHVSAVERGAIHAIAYNQDDQDTDETCHNERISFCMLRGGYQPFL